MIFRIQKRPPARPQEAYRSQRNQSSCIQEGRGWGEIGKGREGTPVRPAAGEGRVLQSGVQPGEGRKSTTVRRAAGGEGDL